MKQKKKDQRREPNVLDSVKGTYTPFPSLNAVIVRNVSFGGPLNLLFRPAIY